MAVPAPGVDIEWDCVLPVGAVASGVISRIIEGTVYVSMFRRKRNGDVVSSECWFEPEEVYRIRIFEEHWQMARSKAPFVATRTDIRKEERVRFTADFAGYNEFESLGRYVSMWCWCTDRGLEDAPDDCDGYAVPDAVVRRFLGPRGVEAILGDGCDELAMGERRADGLIYLRGTTDTVDRLRSWHPARSSGEQIPGPRKRPERLVSVTRNARALATAIERQDRPIKRQRSI